MVFRTRLLFVLCVIALGITLSRCLEPYDPAVKTKDLNVLVIEGYINAGQEQTSIKISKARPLGSGQQILHETEAVVLIESSDGESYALLESTAGTYTSLNLDLSTENQYRLYIKLKNGREYRSTFTPVKVTPAIDSVYWEVKPNFLHIYIGTHDVSNNTRYYQWSYQEDWQIQSVQPAFLVYEDDTVKYRSSEEIKLMLNCWKSTNPQNIVVASSNLYPNDEIKYSINQLPHSGERTNVKYSTIVKQHALQEEEYEYIQLLVKNSSMGGTFFDPMPSQLYGNIHSESEPDEIVIGYIGAYTTQTDTLFIEKHELPFAPSQPNCLIWEFEMFDQDSLNKYMRPPIYYDPIDTWVDQYGIPWMSIIERSCVDCRVYGSTVKPGYWD
jgi:hypothetical protein